MIRSVPHIHHCHFIFGQWWWWWWGRGVSCQFGSEPPCSQNVSSFSALKLTARSLVPLLATRAEKDPAKHLVFPFSIILLTVLPLVRQSQKTHKATRRRMSNLNVHSRKQASDCWQELQMKKNYIKKPTVLTNRRPKNERDKKHTTVSTIKCLLQVLNNNKRIQLSR